MTSLNDNNEGDNMSTRPSKRIRVPTQNFAPDPETAEEQRMLEQALANSRKDTVRDVEILSNIPFGPTFYPTKEEFSGDPLIYLEKIRSVAEKYGICKIVPPEGWNPPFSVDLDCPKKFQTKDQSIHRLQEGISFGDGTEYSVRGYQKMATAWSKKWKRRYSASETPGADTEDGAEKKETDVGAIGEGDLPSTTVSSLEVTSTGPSITSSSSVPHTDPPVTSSSTVEGSDLSKTEDKGGNVANNYEMKMGGDTQQETVIMSPENLERDYWDIVETQSHEVDVDYGNDIDTSEVGSGFPISQRGRSVNSPNFQKSDRDDLPEPEFGTEEYYRETFWNLNNIPNSKNSVLRHLKVGINGINVPWLYFGCLFSTFCWHNEDNYMYSINYHHKGAPKQWYGVPGTKQDADGVERVFKNYLSMKMRDVPDLLHHITTSFSPRILNQEGVRVCKLLQHAGEYIVTFPRAFHGGFSLGPNCGEAVNFALHDWIPHAVDANERYRTFARPSVFSHDRLVYTMAHWAKELRTKEICSALAQELRRLKNEELLLRAKLIKAGVRDVSNDVALPPNRLDQLDEESADYDDKRLCHSCKHICFFSAVCCECSESKVSCLRHSHYMCRCSINRKYLLVWTKEKEMNDTIAKVERRGEELGDSNLVSLVNDDLLEKYATKDKNHHKTYDVSVDPICALEKEVPQLVSSATSSIASARSSSASPELKHHPVQASSRSNDTVTAQQITSAEQLGENVVQVDQSA
eukprot:scaffold11489_cov78-Skeletonema_marinoi.AAC.4